MLFGIQVMLNFEASDGLIWVHSIPKAKSDWTTVLLISTEHIYVYIYIYTCTHIYTRWDMIDDDDYEIYLEPLFLIRCL